VHAIAVQNPTGNASIVFTGNFWTGGAGAAPPDLLAGSAFYMEFAAGITVTNAVSDTLTFTGGASANLIDVWIAGSTT